jgi:hypothetical protein
MVGLWTRTSSELATDRKATESRTTLEYEPAVEVNRTRRLVKRGTLAVFFIAAIAFSGAIVKRVWTNVRMVREQQALSRSILGSPDFAIVDGRSDGGAVFLHRRTRPDAVARLVTVLAHRGLERRTQLSFHTMPMRRFWDSGMPAATFGGSQAFAVDRLFAGQPDPNDASHFTIAYECDGQKGTIDGWLMNDDSVKLEVRDGPLRDK